MMAQQLVLPLFLVVWRFVLANGHTTVPELIRQNGYPCEEHLLTTKDGYILALHRIPHGKKDASTVNRHPKRREPVMMQHGLFSSSASWTLNVTHKSPAYIMADAGYDVWMTNSRGSAYSKNHTHLSPKSKAFWQFSWDEMAKYDVPAFIDYILKRTRKKQLYYIGHSMGTTMFFAGMSEKPEYNKKIKAMFALAPVGTVTFIRTWFRYIAYLETEIKFLMYLVGDYEVAPANSIMMKLVRYYCDFWWGNEYFCENLLFLVVGFDGDEFDESWMPAISDELLSGTSLNTLLHFAQEYKEGRFQHFDFGSSENEKRYRQIVPPEYKLNYVTAPVHLIWGMNDYLADDKDIDFLIRNLPNVKTKYPIPYKKFNHLDFLWAKDAKKMVYDPILKLMSRRKHVN